MVRASKDGGVSSFTGKFRVLTNGTQESTTVKITKRPRNVCSQCQKSKLRCDLGHPCSNCIKKDRPVVCSYEQLTASRSDPNRNTAAEDRLLHLESMVKQLIQSQVISQSSNDGDSTNVISPPLPEGLTESQRSFEFQLKQSKATRDGYVGGTHWSAILDDIDGLKAVLAPSLDVQQREEDLTISEATASSEELIFGTPHHYSLKGIISQYLPTKIEIDRLLSAYFQARTYIHPFIHTYHFQHQYREFWKDTEKTNPLWLSILFSICYMASLMKADTDTNYLSQDQPAFHTAVAKCLILGEYHRPQKYTLEALIMYAQCKNVRSLDPSREVGAILSIAVRIGYQMGYHRDAVCFGTFTAFEGEMRRRSWAVLKQMDLMISFQLGLPSNICLEDCDTKSPSNLLDSDFDADTQVLPESRSENDGTKLLWFIVKERQMTSFSKVCRDALSFKEKSEADILQLDIEVREMHTTIPEILRTRPLSDSIADPPFLIMTRLYVDFIHLKSLCVLHRKYMARGNVFSTTSCVEAGTRLVSQFIDMYKEFAPGGQLHTERWMLSNFTMNDFLLGVMVLCLVLHTRWKEGFRDSVIDTTTESKILDLLEQAHVICNEKSTKSRDARRVSHAIRFTLSRINSQNAPKNIGAQPSSVPGVPGSAEQIVNSEAQPPDPASLYLPPWNGITHGDETAFGLLDPFNFVGDDIEHMDWSTFELGLH